MDGVLDGGSPRRGSLSSLNRQSSGSFSHNSRLSSPSNGLQINTSNLNNLYKDLDKFTRYFIIKTVQVIVQSRIGGSTKIKTECKPTGNDWFNINIADIGEVSDKTKMAIDSDGFSVRSNWRVCCEISLSTNDGGRVVLEHWIISNKANVHSSQSHLAAKINSQQVSPKAQTTYRSSPTHLSTSNNGVSHQSPNNYATLGGRVRSNTTRTRLNSIDDYTSDIKSSPNKLLVGTNNENLDIKSSTSCFSLSSTIPNQMTDQAATMTPSPSISSLSNNQAQAQNFTSNSPQQQQGSKATTMSSIYTIYNRMSLLLKTLITTTHIVPAYRLASKTSSTDPCVICYRVYSSPVCNYVPKPSPGATRGSIEDISYNTDSPNKRSSSSNSSIGSINIRDFVGPDELEYFCPILKLGSIKTDVNELDVSLCYRTDVKNSTHLMRSPISRDKYNRLNEDGISVARQLFKTNDINDDESHRDSIYQNREQNAHEIHNNDALCNFDQPLRPAFADQEPKTDKNEQDPNLALIDSVFEGLLKINSTANDENVTPTTTNNILCKSLTNGSNRSKDGQSDPIQVPSSPYKSKNVDLHQNLSCGSTPKSLTDSFVFVDLNPPFASEEQNDINSFFHGPSPAFTNGFDNLKDVDELTNHLAVIEASASQFDEFVDNICVSEDDEEVDE